jgi:uncharacterized protein (DUF2164 family)
MSEGEPIKAGDVITVEFITKSFEAMWYQGEVLHKRTQDRIDKVEEKLKAHTEQVQKMEEMVKDRIMMFSQDIIATMKEMRAVEQDRINLLFELLNPKPSSSEDNIHESHSEDAVEDSVPSDE